VLLGPIRGWGEDHDVAALVGVQPRRQLVDQDVLIGLQRVLHRLLLDLVRLSDEILDDKEDDQGENECLDDLEETPEHGSSGHKTAQYRGWLSTPPRVLRCAYPGLESSLTRLLWP